MAVKHAGGDGKLKSSLEWPYSVVESATPLSRVILG